MDHLRFASDLPWFTAWASIFERHDCSCGDTTGSNQKMTNDSDTLPQAVAELAEFTGEEPPQDVIAEITRYDDETIANAMAALRQYAGRNAVDNLYGYLLDALRGAWKPGPTVAPTPKEKPRPGPRHADTISDETRQALRSLYL